MSGILDHLSDELKGKYKKPEKNEVRIYELTGIVKKKSRDGVSAYTVPNSRNVPDTYTVIDGDETKSMVYTTKMLPTINPNQTMRKVDPIEFLREDMGRIRITPENYPRMANIDKFLFFSPWVVAIRDENGVSDRPWQVRDKLGQFIQIIDSRGKALAENLKDELITDAKIAIREMSDSDLDIFVLQFKLGMPKYLVEDEKKNLLNKFVTNPKNAQKVLLMKDADGMEMRRAIGNALQANVIGKSATTWFFVDGGEVITKKMPSKTMEDSLMFYFNTKDGAEVKQLIDKTVDVKTKKTPKKKADMTSI